MPRLRQHDNQMRNSFAGCQLQQQSKEMKKLEVEYYFSGDSLQLVNEAFVIEQCRASFKEDSYLDGVIKDAFQWKSNAQMGRFFGAVAAEVHQFLLESGYKFPDKKASLYYMMENLPSESGFGLSDKWVEMSFGPNGNMISRKAMSISGMGKSELHELSEDLTKFLAGMGIEVKSVEEFKESKRLKVE